MLEVLGNLHVYKCLGWIRTYVVVSNLRHYFGATKAKFDHI